MKHMLVAALLATVGMLAIAEAAPPFDAGSRQDMSRQGMVQLAQSPAPSQAPRPAQPAPPGPAVRPNATPSPTQATAPTSACSKLNVNVASATELSQLSGIGDTRAKAIIDGRPYASVDDVRRVIPQVFAGLRDCFVVEQVNINVASASELVAKLPGIGQARATAIVGGRPYQAPEDLVRKNVLTQGAFDGIKPLVTIR